MAVWVQHASASDEIGTRDRIGTQSCSPFVVAAPVAGRAPIRPPSGRSEQALAEAERTTATLDYVQAAATASARSGAPGWATVTCQAGVVVSGWPSTLSPLAQR